MRKFNTTPGGCPIWLDDLKYINDGLNDFQDALSGAIGTAWTVSGSVLNFSTANQVSVSPGWIVLGGQLCRVKAQTVTATSYTHALDKVQRLANTGLHWKIQDTPDTDGSRTLLNAATFNPWTIREAVLTYNTGGAAYVQGSTGWHYLTVISPAEALALRVQDQVKTFIRESSPAYEVPDTVLLNGWELGGEGLFNVLKDEHGWARIDMILDGTNQTALQPYRLPLDFTPAKTMTLPGHYGGYQITIQGINDGNAGMIALSAFPEDAKAELHVTYKAGEQ